MSILQYNVHIIKKIVTSIYMHIRIGGYIRLFKKEYVLKNDISKKLLIN
jgi:hypothetical protein